MIGPSFVEILIVLLIALLVLGPQRLPGIARSIGKGLRELRKVQKEVQGVWTNVEDGVMEPGEKGRGKVGRGGDPVGDPEGDPVGDPISDHVEDGREEGGGPSEGTAGGAAAAERGGGRGSS